MSMRLKTTLLMIMIVFTATSVTFLSGLYFTNKSLEKTVEQDLSFAIGIANSLVGMEMELEKTKAATVAARLSAADSAEKLLKAMEEQFHASPEITYLAVFDRNGSIAGYSVPMHEHKLSAGDEYLEKVYAGGTIMSSPFYCDVQGEFIIDIYTPLGSGRILAMSIPGLVFTDILSRHRLWQTGDMFMLNEEGTFVGAADREVVLAMSNYVARDEKNPERPDGEMEDLIRTILSTDDGVYTYRVDGAAHLCAYSRIDSSLMGWRVAVTVPFAESPQADALRGQTYAAAVLLAIGVISAFSLSKLVAQPFKEIQRQNRDLMKLNETIRTQASAILEEHERIKLMLDATPLACRLWDRQFNLVECNEAAVRLFGLRDKREYLERYFELSPECQPDGQTTLDKIRMSVSEAFDKGECAYEWMYRAVDGASVPCEVTMVRVPYGNDYIVAAYSRDLREQKKMIAAIDHRDNLLQTVNQVADVLLRAEPEGFSDTLRQCMGMMAHAINADRVYLCQNHVENGKLHFTQRHEWSGHVQPYQNTALTTNVAYDEQTPEIRDALLRGECVHSLVRDLPSLDRAQLGEQGVLSILIVPVFIQNDFWGFVGFDNCHSEKLFSENEESIMRVASLQISNALLRNEMVLNLRVAAGQLKTALKEAEEANSAKSSFLASMSHEMRTPLNAVIGLSELTLDGAGLGEDAESNLEKIYGAGTTLLSIVNDILDISKIEAGKFEIIQNVYDVSSMINDAVTQNVLRIGSRSIQFILDIGADMFARLHGDELRVKQIINNLLSNAFKYTDEGTVEFGFSCEREGDAVWLTIRIADTGRGIRPEDRAHLFTDYMRFDSAANRKVGGTGLGLSITKSLVEMMGGRISVESEYGRGSVFTAVIRQQYVNDGVIGADVAENLRRFRYSAGKRCRNARNHLKLPYARVLVVDDNITNLDVARGLMKPYGMQIDCVTGGREAVDVIRKGQMRYNAVFMDHMMPGMDGLEATRLIRRIGTEYARTIPIIALTANAIAGNEKMFLSEGFQAFIPKPIDLARLDDVIRNFVRDREWEATLDDGARAPGEGPGGTGPNASGGGDEPGMPVPGGGVDGLDVSKGLDRFGGAKSFMQILRSYAMNTRPLLESIETADMEDLSGYATTVHGIKGSSRNICAGPVGDQAEALEHAAKAGDSEFVARNNQAFLAAARKLIEGIEFMLAGTEKAKPVKGRPDAGVLAKLRAACDGYDFDGIDEAMEEIERYEYDADDGLVDWLRTNITQMNFAPIAEKLSPFAEERD